MTLAGEDFRIKPQYRTVTAPTAGELQVDTIMTIRRWFFRNLRADRYYQGKHKDTPKGSRWTFVRPTTVGRFKAHTVDNS